MLFEIKLKQNKKLQITSYEQFFLNFKGFPGGFLFIYVGNFLHVILDSGHNLSS